MSDILPDAINFAAIQNILVVKLRHYGDVLLASPVFNTLHRVLPHATVDALVYAETQPLLRHHPGIQQIFTISRRREKQGLWSYARQEFALWHQLKQRKYDLLIHLTEHPRGTWLRRSLGIPHSVAPRLASASWWWRSSFSHHFSTPKNRPRHTVETNLDALRRLGLSPEAADKQLTLFTPPQAQEQINNLLDAYDLAPRPFLIIHPGSRWWFKTWPAEKMVSLIQLLQQDGWAIVLTGTSDSREQRLVQNIKTGLTIPIIDLSGQLTILELAALIRRAHLFIGVDSLPMHIAAAQQTPVVALFGPSGELEWGPWQVPHKIVTSLLHPCRPCGLDGCGGGKISECLQNLPVTQVKIAVDTLLKETSRTS